MMRSNPIKPNQRELLVKLAEERGFVALADEIGLSPPTLGRAVGGLPAYRVTHTAINAYLERVGAI